MNFGDVSFYLIQTHFTGNRNTVVSVQHKVGIPHFVKADRRHAGAGGAGHSRLDLRPTDDIRIV